ncbi:flagellar biosynthesis anti-sigma factor FlgM, partial [Aduncisulcus paluster]
MKINQYSQTPLKAYSDNRVNNAADKTQAQQQSKTARRSSADCTDSPDTREQKVRELRDQ